MEQTKPGEAEQINKISGQDTNTSLDPKGSSQAPNGDGNGNGTSFVMGSNGTSFVMGSNGTSFVMGSEIQSQDPAADQSLNRMASRSRKSVSWSPDLVSESTFNNNEASSPPESNAFGGRSPALSSSTSFKDTVHNVRNVLGRWGNSVGEATKKAEDFAGNTWQHLKTSSSLTDAAMGRIAQGAKILAEGGYEKVFRQTFETVPEEQLQSSYACYLSTSAGPVMGILYLSTAKLAYCSDSPLSYKSGDKTEWSYYKVVIPLHQLKAVNPSTGQTNTSEKYIQVISDDNLEFWFMGFLNYSGAVECLRQALQVPNLQSVL